ncbi:NAD dependent epimerase/dehydratase family protein [Talaromyces stipitatus ATCC 10500]|uniref:NAD dependent epimerase/dehydratase family protein n=1 Tax=Talaromyces stipitatus (strain ATCC 10500 / CBS 375.48 / QM 6759 / NRRL 1006) TaxID=441959 RepID=B8MBU8_TALSN|nr:NAD dependent epimerase/dehydratase family protein [Talaromyces stipitatus ATCC 10500]EED18231.1 NAD dependent epimerase/dehydratase family protein [Talaromyces stipitatus ATCC 10500]
MTGSAIVYHLCKDLQYEKIYTLSRKNPVNYNPNVQHATLDLQGSAEELAKNLKDVPAESSSGSNIISGECDDAVKLYPSVGNHRCNQKTEAVCSACGLKYYGVHLGNCKQLAVKDDPTRENHSWPPNLYYDQQRILKDAAARSEWEWIVTLPEDILGYARGNFMNEATALALPGPELPFPGCKANYFAFNCWTSANLHAKFCLWASNGAQHREPYLQRNEWGDTQSFHDLWPQLVARYGCKISNSMFPQGGTPDTNGVAQYEAITVRMSNRNPIAAHAQRIGVSVDGSLTLFLQIDPEKWEKRKDVNEALGKLHDRYNLDQKSWESATGDFLTFILGKDWSCVSAMSKARGLG